jgi:Zn-dependent M28 family amino/carboxypeptidase
MKLREQPAGAPNVLGWLEGSDPELKHEYVVIGAHLDHLGVSGDQLFPGADDNGSGSIAILSIAKAMAANPIKPKRSVLFIWFTAEEVGLLGSRYYTENPMVPLENMTCMFNIDMVGRNEDQGAGDADADNEGHIHLVGSQRGETALHDLILTANQHLGFEFELDMESVWNRSDQVNFYNKGVPVAFMFGGFHPDYHQPSDKPAQINYLKIQSGARLFYLAVHAAANHGRFPMQPADKP